MSSTLQRTCRNVVVDGCRTSLRLERQYWDALDEVAGAKGFRSAIW
ncbi:ribbon-helix-helix domain-containing protein [Azospirillum argentinense]